MREQHISYSQAFLRGQRDGRLLAEDLPGRTEADLYAEAQLQLCLLSAMGVRIQTADEYVQGLFAGYQATEMEERKQTF